MRAWRHRRRAAIWGGGLIALALFWGAAWRALDGSVVTRVPVLDESYYLREAAAIQHGRLLPGQPFVMSPLYPYLVAATGGGRELDAQGLRVGPPPYGVRILQAALWLGIVLLLYRAARSRLPGLWAVVPPLLFALYRPAAVFVTTTLLEIPLTFAVTLALVLLPTQENDTGRGAHPRATGRAALVGASIGVAMLLRAIAGVLVVPAAMALVGPAGLKQPAARRRLLVLAGTLLAVLAPAVLYNSARSGRLVGPALNGGQNFYIGQGKDASGFFRTFAGFDFESDPAGMAFLSRRTGLPLAGPADADRFWREETLAWVKDHPGSSLLLWLKKIWLHFVGLEIDQVTPLAAWERDGPPLRALPVPWCVLAVAGLAGMIVLGRRPAWRAWAVAVVLFVAAQSVFFVVSRYRMALVPALCLFAGAWGAEVRRRPGRGRWVAVAVAVAAALAVWPWGLAGARATWRATGLANEARRWERFTDDAAIARAEAMYRHALAVDPTQATVWQSLARVLLRQGRDEEAENLLADGVLRAQPAHVVERDLIALLLRRGRRDAALPRLAQYLRDRPTDGEMLHTYAVALDQAGRGGEALAVARQLIAASPDDPQGYVDLGVLLARAGRREEARAAFTRGLQRRPGDPNLRRNLDLLGPATGPNPGPQPPR